MRFLVKATVFDSIIHSDDIVRTRTAFGKKIQQMKASGKMIEGGIFADARGGFFILDADSNVELFEMLGGEMLDHFQIESHPLVSFDELVEFFKRERVG